MCSGGRPCGPPFCKAVGQKRKAKSVKGRSARERAYMAEHDICERCQRARAVHCHHVDGRSGHRRDTSPLMAVCAVCHLVLHGERVSGVWG